MNNKFPTLHNQLPAPVVLVTRGRGREVFDDSSALIRRLEELPALREEVLTIQTAAHAVAEDGIDALNLMLRTVGLRPFFTAARRETTPARALRTRWNWRFLSEYLGWNWRPL